MLPKVKKITDVDNKFATDYFWTYVVYSYNQSSKDIYILI